MTAFPTTKVVGRDADGRSSALGTRKSAGTKIMSAPEGRVRYAVVGAGHIAQAAVLPAFQHAEENSELVALVSSDPEKRAELARRYGIRHTGSYDELESVLRDSNAHAAYVAVPNTLHREFSERCAHVRTHVLCEKPMAMTAEDCLAMISVADRNDVHLMIGYRLHFEAANLRAIEIARSGRIGETRAMASTFSHLVRPDDIRWRADLGGGALFDLGNYCVNAARYLFRDEPIEVFGYQVMGREDYSNQVDEMTCAVLRFAKDRFAHFAVNQAAADVSTYRLLGTRGDLRVEPAYDYTTALEHHLTVDGKTRRRRFPKRDQFAAELVYFSRCVLEGTEPEPNGWEGLADVRVMVAIQEAARTRRPIELEPFERKRRPDLRQNIEKPPVEKPDTVHAPSPSVH
jgi:predicted dehydrogenase